MQVHPPLEFVPLALSTLLQSIELEMHSDPFHAYPEEQLQAVAFVFVPSEFATPVQSIEQRDKAAFQT